MIAAHGLTKQFGSFLAVDSIDFDIPAGKVAGFLGPNGAGKTTTIRMIAGFLPPTRGKATVAGHDVAGAPLAARRSIGYLPESAPLYTEMRVEEYLRFRARLFGISRLRRAAAIDAAVRRCRLEEVRRRPIEQLSKGYRQRVGLAAALLHEPPVLILDEPTVGLDPTQLREVRALIRELAGRHTILLSTHILHEVEQTCDLVIVMARGRVRASGTLEQMRQSGADAGRRGDRRYVVEVNAADPAAILGHLNGARIVAQQRLDGRWSRLTIEAAADAGDLRESIARAVAASQAMLRELRDETPSLEQVFVRLIEEADAAGAPDRRAGQGAAR